MDTAENKNMNTNENKQKKPALNGLLLIDKPAGFTSFDVIAVIRRLTGQKKLGHTGTLDPNATGVLPVLAGSATKLQDLILNHDKSYRASFKLGLTTDTQDIWGSVTGESAEKVSKDEILRVLPEFTGNIEQVPPMFSAVQKNGKRLYELARKGIEVEREARKVTVYSLKLLNFDEAEQCGSFDIACSKGTYVRTLINDMGAILGTGAVMTALRRTKACGFSLDECTSLDEFKNICEESGIDGVNKILRSPESLFTSLDCLYVSPAQAKRFANGGALSADRTALAKKNYADGQIFRMKTRDGAFLGLGAARKSSGLIEIYFQNIGYNS